MVGASFRFPFSSFPFSFLSFQKFLAPMLKNAPTAIRSLRGSSPGWSREMRREELVRMVCTGTSGVAWSSRPGRMRRPARADTASRCGVPGEGLRAGSRQGRRAGTCASRWRARGREGRGGGVSWAGSLCRMVSGSRPSRSASTGLNFPSSRTAAHKGRGGGSSQSRTGIPDRGPNFPLK